MRESSSSRRFYSGLTGVLPYKGVAFLALLSFAACKSDLQVSTRQGSLAEAADDSELSISHTFDLTKDSDWHAAGKPKLDGLGLAIPKNACGSAATVTVVFSLKPTASGSWVLQTQADQELQVTANLSLPSAMIQGLGLTSVNPNSVLIKFMPAGGGASYDLSQTDYTILQGGVVASIKSWGSLSLEVAATPAATINLGLTLPTSGSYINQANAAAFAVAGTCSAETAVISFATQSLGSDTASALPETTVCKNQAWATTLDLRQTSDGLLNLFVNETTAGGQKAAAVKASLTKQTVPPAAALSTVVGATTNVSPVLVTLSFSEPVTALTSDDLTVSGGTVSGFSGSGATYAFNVTPSGQGAFTVDVAANVATDAAGNGNTAAATLTRTYDTVSPTLSIDSPATNVVIAQSAAYTVSFTAADSGGVSDPIALYYSTGSTHCTDGSLTGWTALTTSLTSGDNTSYQIPGGTLPSGSTYYICGRISDGLNAPTYALSAGSIKVEKVATLTLTAPSAANPAVPLNSTYAITYSYSKPDDNATLSLYYSPTGSGACTTGTLISAAVAVTAGGTSGTYNWDSTGVAAGSYYICAHLDDSYNTPVESWSAGSVKLDQPPTISPTSPTATVAQAGSYTITLTGADTDDNATINLYYKTANTGCDATLSGWTSITTALAKSTASYAWTGFSALAGSTYYVCARISDGVNPAVYALSNGTLTIDAQPTFTFTNPAAVTYLLRGDSLTVAWTAADAEETATFQLYYKQSNSGACATGGTQLGGTMTAGVDTTYTFDSSSLSGWDDNWSLYFCASISDGVNTAVQVYSQAVNPYTICTWNGVTSSLYSLAANWTGCNNTFPKPNDLIVVPASAPNPLIVSSSFNVNGFAPGSGGGVVTINSGNWFQIIGQGVVQSDVTIKGDSNNCLDCNFQISTNTTITNATLTLNAGVTLTTNGVNVNFSVGDGTSPGYFRAIGASGAKADWPRIKGSLITITVQGGTSQNSSVEVNGLNDYLEDEANPLFNFKSNYEIAEMDNLFTGETGPYDVTGYGTSMSPIYFESCAGAVLTDTTWSNITFDSGTFNVYSAANCSGFGPINVIGDGNGYGAIFARDYGGIFSWNSTSTTAATCTWTGAVDTSWRQTGNWSDCSNGRNNYPDQNDWVIIPSTANQPVIANDHILVRGTAAGSGGGTITVNAGSQFSIYGADNTNIINSSFAVQGDTTTCTTCYFEITNGINAKVANSASLELKKGITYLTGSNGLYLGDGTTPGHLKVAGGANPAEWPSINNITGRSWGIGGFIVDGGSGSARSKVDVQGLTFNHTGTFLTNAFNFQQNFELVHFDDVNFRTMAPSTAVSTNVIFSDCSNGVFTDTTWQNLVFNTTFLANNYNVDYSGTSCSTPITIDGNSATLGYGGTYAKDPTTALSWTP